MNNLVRASLVRLPSEYKAKGDVLTAIDKALEEIGWQAGTVALPGNQGAALLPYYAPGDYSPLAGRICLEWARTPSGFDFSISLE